MKTLIKHLFNRLGFNIHRIGNERKDIQRVREMEEVYRELVFKDMPPFDDKRIDLMFHLEGTNIGEAIYLVRYLHKTLQLEGDVCEFGVAGGQTSALLAHEILGTEKNIWLFDSFEGLPKPTDKDKLKNDIYSLGSIDKYEGEMAYNVDAVKSALTKINIPKERVKIIPGFIENTIQSSGLPGKVCFAYADFDFYEPTITALNFLNKTLQKGGVVVVDDYDFFSTGAKTAVDEFISANRSSYNFVFPIKSSGNFCIIEKIV